MATRNKMHKIGFIGAGRMATALAQGFIRSGVTSAENVVASDVSESARSQFHASTKAKAVATNHEAVTDRSIIILAVKPQHMLGALRELAGDVTADQLVVSIAAGVTLTTMLRELGETCRLVRVMPNTPCLVGQGASAYARGGAASDEDATTVKELLETVGMAVEVSESQLDAVTGLSGSGPAYAFQIIEGLSDGGVRVGLARDVATRLAAQTLLGAAQMVLETGQHPGELKDAVTSPGGTTIAGLHALERGGLRATLMDAVEAAARRSQELGGS